ncbi:hypothetical protein SSX86_010237 [Deinandra increscens subsp. villosa]|uniref:Protein kinase domain-containing protein n=1 Tax=Deinandra increscens subsp. villosa TaxID=3103831 RepID=A0AAP0H2C3_9ASTR
MEKKKYPVGAEHYVLYEEVGQGVTASVFRAMCIPNNEIVAIKVLDFERGSIDLNNISREAQTMILVDHPNVLKSHCSFVHRHNVWFVMPYMPGGSCLHILKSAHPEGFEEVVIATILREVLKALEYLHDHGIIHRDVKAGNILISERGGIKLGDLGVSACLFDSGDRQRTRNTFVGTPCWMAPEVMEQLHGYDFKADIWSFGITALELAHGHAPFSKYPPMKVLLMTLQNAPPGLDYERDKKFSKSFKQMIASCLVKDPSKRPSAKKLLKHYFFKQAKSNDFIARKLLEGLPALGDRLQALKKREENMLGQKKIADGQKEEMSQIEYKRGISSWDFDLEDLKAQASLLPDEESISDKDQLGNSLSFNETAASEKELPHQLSCTCKAVPTVNSSATSFVGKFESSTNGDLSLQNCSSHNENCNKSDITRKCVNGVGSHSHQGEASSGCIPVNDGELQSQIHVVPTSNGFQSVPLTLTSDEQDEKSKCHVIQQKGRFKVTSEDPDTDNVSFSSHFLDIAMWIYTVETIYYFFCRYHPRVNHKDGHAVIMEHSAGPQLCQGDATYMPQNQTNVQRVSNGISSSAMQLSTGDAIADSSIDVGCTAANITRLEKSKLEASDDKEKELLSEITNIHRRLLYAQEELQKYKAGNAQVKLFIMANLVSIP